MLSRLRSGVDDDSDVIRRATASIRGAALAVVATGARTMQRLQDTTDSAGASVLVTEVRSRLDRANDLLGELEGRAVAYDGPPPRGAPVTGWQVPAVATARAWLDEAHDTALRTLRSSRDA